MLPRALVERIVDLGFRPRHVVFVEDRPDARMWLSVAEVVQRGVRAQGWWQPHIGVQHDAVEQLVAELGEITLGSARPPTFIRRVARLVPGRQGDWPYAGSPPPAEQIDPVIAAVVDYGLPFARPLRSLDALVAVLERDGVLLDPAQMRLVAALCLLGQVDRALDQLAAGEQRLGARTDPLAEQYRTFARRLRARAARV